jgi:hypothetical protein
MPLVSVIVRAMQRAASTFTVRLATSGIGSTDRAVEHSIGRNLRERFFRFCFPLSALASFAS